MWPSLWGNPPGAYPLVPAPWGSSPGASPLGHLLLLNFNRMFFCFSLKHPIKFPHFSGLFKPGGHLWGTPGGTPWLNLLAHHLAGKPPMKHFF